MIEPTLNPYATPQAQVADLSLETEKAELRLFSHRGRIGRLRYLAYGSGAGILYNALVLGVASALGGSEGSLLYSALLLIMFAALLWFSIITAIKRCHDMGISGWWSLTLIVPVIIFAWIFWPGDREANRFGPPPPANTWGVRVLGLLLPVIAFVGILAAIAIPQYKNYTDRARAAQAAAQR